MLKINDRKKMVEYKAIFCVSTCLVAILLKKYIFSENTIHQAVIILFSIIAIVFAAAVYDLLKIKRLNVLMQKGRLSPDEQKELEKNS